MPDRALDLVTSLCAKATPAERVLLLNVLPPSLASRLRYSIRDAAVREALPLMGRTTATGAACELERLLGRYLDGAREQPTDDRPALRTLLHRIAEANGWQPLGWRQIQRVATGERTPLS